MADGLSHVLPGRMAVERCSLSLFQLSLSHPHTTIKPVHAWGLHVLEGCLVVSLDKYRLHLGALHVSLQ